VVVPPYCRSRGGRLFRIVRSSQLVGPDRIRFSLRAQPIGSNRDDVGVELAREIDASLIRDKIAHGQAIPTPEGTLEDLWQQLREDLDAHYG
jgi:hypothetical protein